MTNNPLANLSVQQLRRAITLKEQIEALEQELTQALGAPAPATPAASGRGKYQRSAAARAKMAAAQKARWAKLKGTTAPPPAKVVKRKISPAARARMVAGAKARWQKAKAAGKTTLGA